jgi:hypothetical protein
MIRARKARYTRSWAAPVGSVALDWINMGVL